MESLLKEEGTLQLAENIDRICSSFPTSFGQFECLHGVGHGLMAYDDYALPAALNDCRLLADEWSQSSCYGGVFMENIVSAQGFGAIAGHDTKWVNRDDPHFPCNQLGNDPSAQFQCYQMQTSWMLTLFQYDFAKVANECLNSTSSMISVCYRSYGRDAAGNTLRDPERIIELCDKVPKNENYLEECVGGALNVIVDFWGALVGDHATDLCKLTEDRSKPGCYQTLTGRLNNVFQNPADRKKICAGFEAPYDSQCLTLTQG